MLDPAVRAALAARGYIGAGALSPPDVKMLKTVLTGVESADAGAGFDGSFCGPAASGGAEVGAWARALPPDFKRADVEIYRNIRSAGSARARHRLQRQFTGYRGGERCASSALHGVHAGLRDGEVQERSGADDMPQYQ